MNQGRLGMIQRRHEARRADELRVLQATTQRGSYRACKGESVGQIVTRIAVRDVVGKHVVVFKDLQAVLTQQKLILLASTEFLAE